MPWKVFPPIILTMYKTAIIVTWSSSFCYLEGKCVFTPKWVLSAFATDGHSLQSQEERRFPANIPVQDKEIEPCSSPTSVATTASVPARTPHIGTASPQPPKWFLVFAKSIVLKPQDSDFLSPRSTDVVGHRAMSSERGTATRMLVRFKVPWHLGLGAWSPGAHSCLNT